MQADRPDGPSTFALVGARIFDGERLVDDQAVAIANGRVSAVVPAADLPAGMAKRSIQGLLAPGFIDTQVNGGGGVLFNASRTVAGIATIARVHRRFGTTGLLPTFITDSRPNMAEAIAACEAAIAAAIPGILGIHLEGPFLNPQRAGAHDRRSIRPIEEADIALITARRRGTTLLTLAPEVVPAPTIARLASAEIVVAAGHTEASVATIAEARAAGLTGFTHLFNAMPPLSAREPGPVGAALADPSAWAGLIVDLSHVSVTSLKVAIAARGTGRTMLVTDAMPTVGTELDRFDLDGRVVRRVGGRLLTEEGRLAGSNLDMATAVRNAVHELGLPLAAALAAASRVPAEFLGLGGQYGRIAPGYNASLVLLDDDLQVTATWIDGAGSVAG